MLSPAFIKENLKDVKKNIIDRFMSADADLVVSLYDKRNKLLSTIENLRQQRNENAKKMKSNLSNEERSELISSGKNLKTEIFSIEEELTSLENDLSSAQKLIPNMAHPDSPRGKEEKDNLEIKRSGEPTSFKFKPKDHVELGQELDIIDFERAANVSGPKFYYLKNQGAMLEMSLVRFAMDKLTDKGFTITITPDIAREEILEGIGFNPRGEESNIYTIAGTDKCLVGTAEITLGGYHANQILNLTNGPIKMAGFSHCFRREAGAAGQYSKGLYRVHQFSKVEMFILCKPEESNAIHEELRSIEEEIFNDLAIPFRVVDTCTGDLGAPAYRKYDLEAWMPGRGENGDWGEVTSTSNCTDYQARRLNIRYKDDNGKNRLVHMLNGTAIAVSRAIIAILENGQNADGTINIPKKLVSYMGTDKISK